MSKDIETLANEIAQEALAGGVEKPEIIKDMAIEALKTCREQAIKEEQRKSKNIVSWLFGLKVIVSKHVPRGTVTVNHDEWSDFVNR